MRLRSRLLFSAPRAPIRKAELVYAIIALLLVAYTIFNPENSPIAEATLQAPAMVHPLQCDATVNGRCYQRSENR